MRGYDAWKTRSDLDEEERRRPRRRKGACRICGCTENDACLVEIDGEVVACRWVEPDLCSACAPPDRVAGTPTPEIA